MTGRRLALAGVVVLAVLALVVGLRGDGEPPAAPQADTAELVGLRQQAGLAPCPAGLGPAMPDAVLPCLGGGEPVDLRSAAPGRPTLVNVWATWCAPCVEEVPALAAFAARAGDRVGLVGVLLTDSQRSALTFAPQFGMTWPSVVDDDGVVRPVFGTGVPLTVFLDASGEVAFVKSGAFSGAAEVEQLVAEHLGVVL